VCCRCGQGRQTHALTVLPITRTRLFQRRAAAAAPGEGRMRPAMHTPVYECRVANAKVGVGKVQASPAVGDEHTPTGMVGRCAAEVAARAVAWVRCVGWCRRMRVPRTTRRCHGNPAMSRPACSNACRPLLSARKARHQPACPRPRREGRPCVAAFELKARREQRIVGQAEWQEWWQCVARRGCRSGGRQVCLAWWRVKVENAYA